MKIDPRFVRRRARVKEEGARRFYRRSLILIGVLAMVSGAIWLSQSPAFSVASIEVDGQTRADVDAALAEAEVYLGRPLILVNTGRVESILENDPWVRAAEVRRRLPDKVSIDITERRPVAAMKAGERYVVVTDDGRGMRHSDEPVPGLAVVDVSHELTPGQFLTAPRPKGILAFINQLSAGLAQRTRLWLSGSELWASVDGHAVRLGSAIDGGHKALTVSALIESGEVTAGDVIDVVAPARPALYPRPLVEAQSQPIDDG